MLLPTVNRHRKLKITSQCKTHQSPPLVFACDNYSNKLCHHKEDAAPETSVVDLAMCI